MVDLNRPVIMDPDTARFAFANMSLARILGNAVARAYPQRRWGIHADSENGIIDVMCPDVSNRWGYCIHLKHKTIEQLERECVRAAGEILERFSLSREKHGFNRDSVTILPRDFRGDAIGGN